MTTIQAPDMTAWSKSTLGSLLDGCAWQWLVTRVGLVDDPDMPQHAIGTAFHYAVEQHEQHRIAQRRSGLEMDGITLEEMLHIGREKLDKEWHNVGEDMPAKHGITLEDAHQQVTDSIHNWWNHARTHIMGWVPYAAEPHAEGALESGVMLHGYIDIVYWDPPHEDTEFGEYHPGEWVVVDHKSAGGLGYWPEDGAGHELEGALYEHIARSSRGLPVDHDVRMEWHVVRKRQSDHARFIPFRRIVRKLSGPQWDKVLNYSAGRAQDMLDTGTFEKNPDWNLCSAKWCPLYHECEETGELTPDTVEVLT